MLEQILAEKIIDLCMKHNIKGDAYAFGDQIAPFSREWVTQAWENISHGIPAPKYVENNSGTISSEEFYKFCGFSSYTDIDYNGKAKILLDLGKPLPEEMYGKADLLYDGGVIEHIPNIFQAMCNAALLLKKGGILIEAVPTACFGEAYYNIDPMLFHDFYGANGFETIECLLYCNSWYYKKIEFDHSLGSYLREINRIFIEKIKNTSPFRRIKRANIRIREKLKKFQVASYIKENIVSISSNLLSKHHRIKIFFEKLSYYNPSNSNKRKYTNDPFDPEDVCYLNPFDPSVKKKIRHFGMPPRTHVVYIGVKRSDINSQDIHIPRQDVYPGL